MSVINQKEYLKKYLSLGDEKEKNKKRKKKSRIIKDRVKIIDDDIDVPHNVNEEEMKEFLTAEDAPQVVGMIDDRPLSMRIDDYRKSDKWKLVGSDDELKEKDNQPEVKVKQNRQSDSDPSPPRKSRKSYKDDDLSPPRARKLEHSKKNSRLNDSDTSPPRKSKKYDSDTSPIRKSKKRFEDASPPRRTRKRNSDSDVSSPRNIKKEPDSDTSPPRKSRRDSDVSPRRKSRRQSDSDGSPPRRSRKMSNVDNSPKKQKRLDTDLSPPRRNSKSSNLEPKPLRKSRWGSNADLSPTRNLDKYSNSSSSKSRNKYDSDSSPPKRSKSDNRYENKKEKSNSKRDKRSPSPETSGVPQKKMTKTLDGKTAGIQFAGDLVKETAALKKREDEMFKNMSAEVSGKDAAPVMRDRKTGKKRDLEKEAEVEFEKQKIENERKAKYDKWGKGLKQVEDHKEKVQQELHEMSKPLARYADDEDLEKYLKDQEREGDPMLQYIRKKKRKDAEASGNPLDIKPQYDGEFMPNRFGIPPGHRWDGVDRSNGYEKEWFKVQNSKKAVEEDIYKWSTEDM